MYTVVKSCIRFQSSRSRFFSSHIGLKQGDPGSPLMFMMFIKDIAQNMHAYFDEIFTVNELRLFILLYANDSPLDDPGKKKFRCTPRGTKVVIYHLVGNFMLNSMHNVVSLATCAESL